MQEYMTEIKGQKVVDKEDFIADFELFNIKTEYFQRICDVLYLEVGIRP